MENKKTECSDKLCPFHGEKKLRLRGRILKGTVTKKFPRRITIEFERMVKIPKYERFEKRKTTIKARLPDCLEKEINKGDIVEVYETRPISKTIHFVATKLLKSSNESNSK